MSMLFSGLRLSRKSWVSAGRPLPAFVNASATLCYALEVGSDLLNITSKDPWWKLPEGMYQGSPNEREETQEN